MRIKVLSDLQQEFNRLFIAGSKFAGGDPRIAKLIPTLEKMGEKAPVMKKLAQQTDTLLKCKPEESAVPLADTSALLYAVLSTQLDTYDDNADSEHVKPPSMYLEEFPATPLPYTIFGELRWALTTTNSGRHEIISEAFKNKQLNDERLYPLLSQGLDDKYAAIAEFLRDDVIPSLGACMLPYLLEDFEPTGRKSHAVRFNLLEKLGYEKIDELANEVLYGSGPDYQEPSAEVMAAAVEALGNNPANEQKLLDMLSHKKQDVKEAAFCGLIKIDSETGKEKLFETLRGKKPKPAFKALNSLKDGDGASIRELCTIMLETGDKVDMSYKNGDGKKLDKEGETAQELIRELTHNIAHMNPEPFLDTYAEILKSAPLVYDGIIVQLTAYPNKTVYDFLKKIVDKKMYSPRLPMKELMMTFYRVAVHHCDESQIFDLFYDSYKNGYFKGFYGRYSFDQSEKFDDRWAELFIVKRDYDILSKIIVKKTALSEKKMALIWKFLLKEIETVCKEKTINAYFRPLLARMIENVPPELAGKLALGVSKYIEHTIGSGLYIHQILSAIEKNIEMFRQPGCIKIFEGVYKGKHGKQYSDFIRDCELLGIDVS